MVTMEHPVNESMASEAPLPSVATVLQNHHLAKISDDNARLRDEHASLDSVLKSVTTVTIRYGDGHEIAADLARSYWQEIGVRCRLDDFLHFTELPRDEVVGKQIVVPFDESPAAPLSQLKDIFACWAYQRVGEMYGICNARMEEDENGDARITSLVLLSETLAVRVNITGLSDADVQRFTEKESGLERLWDYLQTGTGLLGDEGVFTPYYFQYRVTDEVKEIVDLLCVDYKEQGPLPSAMKETELPSLERLRRGIITAIGASDVQMGVLEDNKELRFESRRLDAFVGILGTVKFDHPDGARFIKLKDGKTVVNCTECDCPNSRVWVIDCSGREDLVFEMDDLRRLRPMLSGTNVHSQGDLEPLFGFGENSTMDILMECDNGTAIYGKCDTDDPEGDTEVNLMTVVFPLTLLKETLDALGIDYSAEEPSDSPFTNCAQFSPVER